ncbi:MAG: four helix bundle protein [Saprospiraceae bacterium]|nr:four helix bundle protein [Saprospiraceae bacterium]MCB9322632.1 four helix bundle protein [Lewinellaceae bacterium]
MFDFEKLDIYQHLNRLSVDILKFMAEDIAIDVYYKKQLKEAILKSLYHLTESTGRMEITDKKNFIVSSRCAIFECVAILHVIDGVFNLAPDKYEDFYDRMTSASKMLLAMYRSFERK